MYYSVYPLCFENYIIFTKIEDNKIFVQLNSVNKVLTQKGDLPEDIFVDEVNLYRLVFAEHNKNFFEFQDWLVNQALPHLREKI